MRCGGGVVWRGVDDVWMMCGGGVEEVWRGVDDVWRRCGCGGVWRGWLVPVYCLPCPLL